MKNPIEIVRRHPRSASACHPSSVLDACLVCPSGTL